MNEKDCTALAASLRHIRCCHFCQFDSLLKRINPLLISISLALRQVLISEAVNEGIHKNYTAKRPKQRGVGSQCARYNQQSVWNSNKPCESSRNLLGPAQEATLCLVIKTSHQNFIPGPGHLRKFQIQKIVKKGLQEIFRQELRMTVPEELSYKHQRKASSRS